MSDVLENAEYYLLDAERFLNQHKYELGILSIGYAEGLIDSLRFQKNINPWLPNLLPHFFKDIFYILMLRTIIITEMSLTISEVGY